MKKLLFVLISLSVLTMAMEQPPKRGLKRIAQDIDREEQEIALSLARMEGNIPAPVREMPSSDIELAASSAERQEPVEPIEVASVKTKAAIEALPLDLRKMIIFSLAQAEDPFRAQELKELLEGTSVSVQEVGGTTLAHLFRAADGIRNLLMSSKTFVPLLKDVKFTQAVMMALQKTYGYNFVTIAIALGTDAAARVYASAFNVESIKVGSLLALVDAIKDGDISIVNFIFRYLTPVQAASLVNTVDVINDLSLLMLAIRWQRTQMVERLLQVPGININLKNHLNDFALLIAVIQNNITAVDRLIAAGADVNLIGPQGWTPLMSAAWRGYTVIVDRLLRVPGINVDASGIDHGRRITALICAVQKGHNEIVRHLLPRVNLDRQGFLALVNAVARGYVDIVKILIDAGVDINAGVYEGTRTLLETVLRHPDLPHREAMIKLLVDHGARE